MLLAISKWGYPLLEGIMLCDMRVGGKDRSWSGGFDRSECA